MVLSHHPSVFQYVSNYIISSPYSQAKPAARKPPMRLPPARPFAFLSLSPRSPLPGTPRPILHAVPFVYARNTCVRTSRAGEQKGWDGVVALGGGIVALVHHAAGETRGELAGSDAEQGADGELVEQARDDEGLPLSMAS